MAETTVRAGLTPQQWDDKFFMEYVRENRFARYQGTDENAIFQLKEDLTRKPGDRVTFAAVRALGGGVRGNGVLVGNEAELDNRSMTVAVNPLRNAVVETEWDEQKSAIDLRMAARTGLKNWSMEMYREDILVALKSIPNTAGVNGPYETALATDRNAWLVANSDRVLFGASVANASSGVMSTALATVDNTADKLSTSIISLAKRRAQMARPRMRPTKIKGDEEWYIWLTNSLSFRDLQNDTAMQQANRDARPRDVMENPLFNGGDLIWDGVIIREVPEMGLPFAADATTVGQTGGIIPGVGAGGIDVGFNFLLGAQALGIAWARRPKSTINETDYEFRKGVGIREIRGIDKLMFGTGVNDRDTLKQNGVFTTFTAAVSDA